MLQYAKKGAEVKHQMQTLRGQERGFAHVGMVLIVVAVVAVIGFVGYTVYNKSGVGTKASTATTTTTQKTEAVAADQGCVTTYKDENLCKFAAKGGALDKLAFKATAVVTGGDSAGNLTMLNDGAGNSSVTMSGGGVALDSVTYGGHYYIKNGQGSWTDYGTDTESGNPTKDMNLVLGSGLTYTPQGKEACGSHTCFKYDLKDASSPNDEQTVWFDTANYLARQWKDVSTGDDGTATTTVLTINYPGKVSVSKPSPVVPLSQ
jgi:Tfp pilus assembly protein PilE